MARREFTEKTKDAAWHRSGGICECHLLRWIPAFSDRACGQALATANGIYYEHINTDYNSKDNSLDNCAVLIRGCWRLKTDTYDKSEISKTKRMSRRDRGIKTAIGRPMPGTRASGIRRRLSGKVEKW